MAGMKTTFTPGPWEFDQSGQYMTFDCVRNNGMVVCKILPLSYESHGSAEANGRLIAKAPELFALVVRLIEQAEENDRRFKGAEGSEVATERDLTLFDAWAETLRGAAALLAEVRGDV